MQRTFHVSQVLYQMLVVSSYSVVSVSVSMSDVQEIWERAERLYALALKARDDNLIEYALQLEQLAAEASAHAERLGGEFQEPRGSNAAR